MSNQRQLPSWSQPRTSEQVRATIPPLKIYNSLTRTKTPFVPIHPLGKQITWYVCGPTVYNDAHLGHARNYVCTDIIRRIMRDYFKFDVRFVMNITDIDDKIILRARQRHLFSKFEKQHHEIDSFVLDYTSAAYRTYISTNLPLMSADVAPSDFASESSAKYGMVMNETKLSDEEDVKTKMHVQTVLSAAAAMVKATNNSRRVPATDFYASVKDILMPYLDLLEGSKLHGDEHAIFSELSSTFERRFMEDMSSLNCLEPDVLTRVTEYCPQIVSFVQRIIQNGFAYTTASGSVYFDIAEFERKGHFHARLEPWSKVPAMQTPDPGLKDDARVKSEKVQRKQAQIEEKRLKHDFALWKASYPGEPSWDSPWGRGRPGWHIECSAMASDTLGSKIDIHSGGIDLAFPHHDNEIAQSEAYFYEPGKLHEQWVNYFLHMGHLSIQGAKMSKSLKNFTTIRESLKRGDWTPRSLRIFFLLGSWKDGIEITPDLLQAKNAWEDKVDNFFVNIKSALEEDLLSPSASGEDTLLLTLQAAQTRAHDALCDSFDTFEAMQAIADLITAFNSTELSAARRGTVLQVAQWVTSMVNIFGLNGESGPDDAALGWSGLDLPPYAMPAITSIVSVRDDLRIRTMRKEAISTSDLKHAAACLQDAAKQATPTDATLPFTAAMTSFSNQLLDLSSTDPSHAAILALCDRVRDVQLFDLGVHLEDREGRPALARPVTRYLLAARENAAAMAIAKQAAAQARKTLDEERAVKARVSHLVMFKTAEFGAWDENGVPTRMSDGVEVPKSRAKRLRKEWERQKKAHTAYLEAKSALNGLASPTI